MSLSHCIIHSIEKTHADKSASLQLRPEENNKEGSITSLFQQLKTTFSRSSQKLIGQFNPEKTDNPLPGWLTSFCDQQISFVSFSHHLLQHLKQSLDHSQEILSAHLFIAVEELLDEPCLYIFWLEHTEAFQLNSHIEECPIRYINTQHLPFCLKCNIAQRSVAGWDQYLSQVTKRGNKLLTQVWEQFTGFQSSIDLPKQTQDFLINVNHYASKMSEPEAKQLKHQVVDYCIDQNLQGNPIDLNDLSEKVNSESPEDFSHFIQTQSGHDAHQLYTDRKSLKAYQRFFGRDKNLSISFSSDMFGKQVNYDSKTGTLTFEKIPQSLKTQLNQYLKEQTP